MVRALDRAVLEVARGLDLRPMELYALLLLHGAEPIEVRLTTGTVTRLSVDDRGTGAVERDGLGLALVRRLVEQGLHGRFELSRRAGGGMHAEVVFPTVAQ